MCIHLYGRFGHGLTVFSSFATLGSIRHSALPPLCELILAGSHPAPPVITRKWTPHHIPQAEARPNLTVSLSIEDIDRGTKEPSRIEDVQ